MNFRGSAPILLVMKSGTLAHGTVLLTFRKSLPSVSTSTAAPSQTHPEMCFHDDLMTLYDRSGQQFSLQLPQLEPPGSFPQRSKHTDSTASILAQPILSCEPEQIP